MRASILSFLGGLVVSLWSRTLRIQYHNQHIPDRLTRNGRNVIYAFWHGSLVLLIGAYRNSGIVIPTSESRDGEIMARVLARFGYRVVRGASNRRGQAALRGLIREMKRGRDAAIAVDGPRGPRHEAKAGALFLGGTAQAPVIPVAAAARRHRVLERSWEKAVIPSPFTTVVVHYGEPVWVTDRSASGIEQGRMALQASLRQLSSEAEHRAAALAVPWTAGIRSAVSAAIRDLMQSLRRRHGSPALSRSSRSSSGSSRPTRDESSSAAAPSRSHRSPDR